MGGGVSAWDKVANVGAPTSETISDVIAFEVPNLYDHDIIYQRYRRTDRNADGRVGYAS